jgi:hypothetical protein
MLLLSKCYYCYLAAFRAFPKKDHEAIQDALCILNGSVPEHELVFQDRSEALPQSSDPAKISFGPQARLQERYPDPEVQGGKIALVASNNNIVQKPPNSLDRMHASLPKQMAYNQRVFAAEDEIAGINFDFAEFLSQISPDPAEPAIICVNSGESLKRHEEHLGGQLWIQGDRIMTATNKPFEGMSKDAESATLSGVAEAVEWAHVLEDAQPKRTTQRVVIYPPTLTEFSRVLSGDCSNFEAGHEIAYQRIQDACSKYVAPLAFYAADS